MCSPRTPSWWIAHGASSCRPPEFPAYERVERIVARQRQAAHGDRDGQSGREPRGSGTAAGRGGWQDSEKRVLKVLARTPCSLRRRDSVSALLRQKPNRAEQRVPLGAAGRSCLRQGIFRKYMDKFVVTGGVALNGEIPTNGSKNLRSRCRPWRRRCSPARRVTLQRIPRVRDIRTACSGAGGHRVAGGYRRLYGTAHDAADRQPRSAIRTGEDHAPASSLVLGPLVASVRAGRAYRCAGRVRHRARGPSTCTSSDWNSWARASIRRTADIEAVAPDGLRGAMP